MAFRDDRDAQAERIATLERELALATRAVAEGERAQNELAAVQKQLAAALAERDQLRRGTAPLVASLRRNFVIFAVVTVGGAAAFTSYQMQSANEARRRESDRADAAELRADVCADDAERARVDAERELDEARAPIPAPPVMPVMPPSTPPPAGIHESGRVAAVHGAAGVRVGDACEIDVRYQSATGDCHASVVCDGHDLYPHGGGGFLPCEVSGDRITGAREENPTSPSGDPALEVRRGRGRGEAVVWDEGPSWRVEITFADTDNPF